VIPKFVPPPRSAHSEPAPHLDHPIVPSSLDHLAVKTRYSENASDNLTIEFEAIGSNQWDVISVAADAKVLKQPARVPITPLSHNSRRPQARPDLDGSEDPDGRLFFAADQGTDLIGLQLQIVILLIRLRLNRRQQAAAFSSQRFTVFQASCLARAMADLLTPSTLRAATSSNVARRCRRR
jgi:hypothetical protein